MYSRSGKFFSSTILAVAMIFFAGCATTPPEPVVDYNPTYDFSKVRTIAFLPQSGMASGDSPRALLSDMQVNRIDLALEKAVEAKGYDIITDTNKADALVTWHLVAQEKTDVRTYNTGPARGGYYGRYGGYNRAAMYNCWNCGGTEVSVRQYTQGTFIVDIIDPGLKKSVWRSVTQSRLKGELQQEQEPYNVAAQRIMAAYPAR